MKRASPWARRRRDGRFVRVDARLHAGGRQDRRRVIAQVIVLEEPLRIMWVTEGMTGIALSIGTAQMFADRELALDRWELKEEPRRLSHAEIRTALADGARHVLGLRDHIASTFTPAGVLRRTA